MSTANSSPPSLATVSVGSVMRSQPVGDLDEQQIPAGVTERVVDPLEVVEVEQQHRAFGAVLRRTLPKCRRQSFTEQGPIRQVGQRVVHCTMGQFELGALAIGDVDQHGAHPALASLGRHRGSHLDVDACRTPPDDANLGRDRLSGLAGQYVRLDGQMSIVGVNEVEQCLIRACPRARRSDGCAGSCTARHRSGGRSRTTYALIPSSNSSYRRLAVRLRFFR